MPTGIAQGFPLIGRGACAGQAAAESVSLEALRSVGDAVRKHDFETALKSAQAPGSGLKVTLVHRDEHGRIADLCIVNSKNGCPVVTKHLHRGH